MHSTALGGQVVAELNAGGQLTRGYVYAGGQLVATQINGSVYWTHQDPVNKSQRLTDMWGNIVAGIELDPWGGETNRSWNTFYQPHRYTSWERGTTGDESLFRRYHGWFSRFAHPDPYDGSYNSTDPQSFNRYAYVQNDPVNFIDPSGLESLPPNCGPGTVAQKDAKGDWQCVGVGNSEVTVYGSWDDMSGYLPDWTAGSSNHFFFGLLMAIPLTPLLPQDRLPSHPPSRPAPNRSQQKQFNDCVKPHVAKYWQGFKRTAGKALLGTVGTGVGIAAFAGAPAVGFGVRAAGATLGPGVTGTRLFVALSEVVDGGTIGLVPMFSGVYMVQGLSEMIENRRIAESAVADCAQRFPNASHNALP